MSVNNMVLRATELGLVTHLMAGFNEEKAKEILKDAGYTYQGNELYKDGERVEIEYLSTTSERQWQTIAQYVQERLRKLGIKAELKQLFLHLYIIHLPDKNNLLLLISL